MSKVGKMTDEEYFAQGVRAGYEAGKGRGRDYTVGEDELRALEAVKAQNLSEAGAWHWRLGYQAGYLRAVLKEDI